MKNFRDYYLIEILNAFDLSPLPLDVFLSNFFRSHKSIGSKDRKYISEQIYSMVRWQILLDHLCQKPVTWEKRFQCFNTKDLSTYINDASLPPHIRVSFPEPLFKKLAASFSEKTAIQFCLTSNRPAPTTIRINPIKTTREALINNWIKTYNVQACSHSPYGITFNKRINFFEMEEFKNGLFEIQDEGSQIVAANVEACPGQHVLDFCAGAGGKTLAFAHRMNGKGQIYLYDIRSHALLQAKKRLKRAGIQNAQYLTSQHLKKNGLLKRMDWILLDVPCSGSGTLRRNPDMKKRFHLSMIENLIQEQRAIFAQAFKYLAPNGHIVYATCSILPDENQEQIDYFLKTYNLKLTKDPFFTFPQQDGMDGFFAAVLTRI